MTEDEFRKVVPYLGRTIVLELVDGTVLEGVVDDEDCDDGERILIVYPPGGLGRAVRRGEGYWEIPISDIVSWRLYETTTEEGAPS